jgi:hypothetical protein
VRFASKNAADECILRLNDFEYGGRKILAKHEYDYNKNKVDPHYSSALSSLRILDNVKGINLNNDKNSSFPTFNTPMNFGINSRISNVQLRSDGSLYPQSNFCSTNNTNSSNAVHPTTMGYFGDQNVNVYRTSSFPPPISSSITPPVPLATINNFSPSGVYPANSPFSTPPCYKYPPSAAPPVDNPSSTSSLLPTSVSSALSINSSFSSCTSFSDKSSNSFCSEVDYPSNLSESFRSYTNSSISSHSPTPYDKKSISSYPSLDAIPTFVPKAEIVYGNPIINPNTSKSSNIELHANIPSFQPRFLNPESGNMLNSLLNSSPQLVVPPPFPPPPLSLVGKDVDVVEKNNFPEFSPSISYPPLLPPPPSPPPIHLHLNKSSLLSFQSNYSPQTKFVHNLSQSSGNSVTKKLNSLLTSEPEKSDFFVEINPLNNSIKSTSSLISNDSLNPLINNSTNFVHFSSLHSLQTPIFNSSSPNFSSSFKNPIDDYSAVSKVTENDNLFNNNNFNDSNIPSYSSLFLNPSFFSLPSSSFIPSDCSSSSSCSSQFFDLKNFSEDGKIGLDVNNNDN